MVLQMFTLLVCRCCFLSDCDGFSVNAAPRQVTGFHSHVTSAPPCCRKSSAAPHWPSDYGLIRAGARRGRGAESLRLGKILASFFNAKFARLYALLWWFFSSFQAAENEIFRLYFCAAADLPGREDISWLTD